MSQTTVECGGSNSNRSLVTAGLPSDLMTTRRIISSVAMKQRHPLNQNRAIKTSPYHLDRSQRSRYTILSSRTMSDTYLNEFNLSRDDVNDVMTALHTLARCVRDGIEEADQCHTIPPCTNNETHRVSMLYSKSVNHALKKGDGMTTSPFRCHRMESSKPSERNRKKHHSMSTERWLDHRAMKRLCFYPVEEFQHHLYEMNRERELQLLRKLQYRPEWFKHHQPSYASYSSNAMIHTLPTIRNPYHHMKSTSRRLCCHRHLSSLTPPSDDRHEKSMKNEPTSSTPLSIRTMADLVHVDSKEQSSSIQKLPQQVHTLQILQNLVSIDSLKTKSSNQLPVEIDKPLATTNQEEQGPGICKADVATQWSLQLVAPSRNASENTIIEPMKMDVSAAISSAKQDTQEGTKLHLTRTNSTALTELSRTVTSAPKEFWQSMTTTIRTNFPAKLEPLRTDLPSVMPPTKTEARMCIDSSCKETFDEAVIIDGEGEVSKRETERLLTTLNIPTCKCSDSKLQTIIKHQPMDDGVTRISFDSDSSLSSKKESMKKVVSKRARRSLSKSTKKTSKKKLSTSRKRARRRSSPSFHSSTVVFEPIRIRKPFTLSTMKSSSEKEDSSFDLFDFDTSMSDTCDRLFTETTPASDKSRSTNSSIHPRYISNSNAIRRGSHLKSRK